MVSTEFKIEEPFENVFDVNEVEGDHGGGPHPDHPLALRVCGVVTRVTGGGQQPTGRGHVATTRGLQSHVKSAPGPEYFVRILGW